MKNKVCFTAIEPVEYFATHGQLPTNLCSGFTSLNANTPGKHTHSFSPGYFKNEYAFMYINPLPYTSLAVAANYQNAARSDITRKSGGTQWTYINANQSSVFYLNFVTNSTKTDQFSHTLPLSREYNALGSFQVQATLECNTTVTKAFSFEVLDGELKNTF